MEGIVVPVYPFSVKIFRDAARIAWRVASAACRRNVESYVRLGAVFLEADLIRLFIRIVLGLIYIISAEAYQPSASMWRHAHRLQYRPFFFERSFIMLPLIVDFVTVSLGALLVGAMFCAWLIFNPAQLDASQYIIVQQQGIRTLNTVMPLLGGLTILMSVVSAVLAREDKTRMSLLIGTAVLFIISGLITRFGNQPINAIVRGWNSAAPPDQWTVLRDTWWRWHCMRLCTVSAGSALLIVATLMRRTPSLQTTAMTVCRPLFDVLMRTISLLL
jgi:uncharacterized membrane protein